MVTNSSQAQPHTPINTKAIRATAFFNEGSAVGQKLVLYLDELQSIRTVLDGNDLIAMGVSEGPRIGELLSALLETKLDGLLSTRGDEEAYLRKLIQDS